MRTLVDLVKGNLTCLELPGAARVVVVSPTRVIVTVESLMLVTWSNNGS